MGLNKKIIIDESLKNDILSYCQLNSLDHNKYINDLLRKSFMVDKYGEKPPFLLKIQKNNEKIETNPVPPKVEDKEEKEAEEQNEVIETTDETNVVLRIKKTPTKRKKRSLE